MPEKKHSLLRIILWPFAIIYGFVTFIRNMLFDLNILKERKFQIPIISVGNITAGGTGKTPHIEYLAGILKEEFNIAVLSRGYKRETRNFRIVTEQSDYKETGDEPLQIKKKYPRIKVAVDRKRVNGVNKLLSAFSDLEVILLDDAFQHRYIKPGLSILLIDYSKPLKNDLILPAGRLREYISGRKRADIIIVTKCPVDIKQEEKTKFEKDLILSPPQEIFFSKINYGDLLPVFRKNKQKLSLDQCKKENYNLLLVTGIANPKPLKDHLKFHFVKISEIRFPDHHSFTEKDVSNILNDFEKLPGKNNIILTTEKDAIRMQKFSNIADHFKNIIYYIPVSVELESNKSSQFKKLIKDYVTENR